MLKRTVILILVLFLAACRKVPTKAADLSAMVIADLHLQLSGAAENPYVSFSSVTKEVLDTAAEEVTDRKPDVLILCGDNTNSGSEADLRYLHDVLLEVKQSGTDVIVIPGNHDLDLCPKDQFRDIFVDITEPEAEDSYSLSYMKTAGNVMILAMDDCSYRKDHKGEFSPGTMKWLKEMLKEADERRMKVLFVSHHNVLTRESGDNYHIVNKELKPLLKKHHAVLCLSGHTHSQTVLDEDGIYEVITGTILGGIHPLGILTMKDNTVRYEAAPADFRRYGCLGEWTEQLDEAGEEAMKEVFLKIFREKGYSAEEAAASAGLVMKFMYYYGSGTLADHAGDMLNHPDYDNMIKGLSDTNYGPWMQSLLQRPPRKSDLLEYVIE